MDSRLRLVLVALPFLTMVTAAPAAPVASSQPRLPLSTVSRSRPAAWYHHGDRPTGTPLPLLTLHLQARPVAFGYDLGPLPPDMPPGVVTVTVPLYPGATPTTQPYYPPGFAIPRIPYLKTAGAEYRVPTDTTTADAWLRRAFARLGYTASDGGYTYDGGIRTRETFFTPNGDANGREPGRQVQLSYQAAPHGGTLVLYFAYAVTIPPRAPGSYLPPSIVRVDVSVTIHQYRPPPGGVSTVTRTITTPTAIARLVAAVNSLPHSNGGHVIGCIIRQRAMGVDMAFVRHDGTFIPVSAHYPCGHIVVATYPALAENGRFFPTLRDVLHLPPL